MTRNPARFRIPGRRRQIEWRSRLAVLVVAVVFLLSSMFGVIRQARAQADWADEYYAEYDRRVTPELEKRIAGTPPPESASRVDQCAFFQQRGVANYAVGRYAAAISDFDHANRLGADVTGDPRCQRSRIRSDTNAAYRASGDVLGQIAYLKRTIDELGTDEPYQLFLLRAKLVSPNLELGRVDEAKAELEAARKEISVLQRKRSWEARQDNIMGTLHAVDANIQMIEGNYRTAEKLAREALDERRRFLLKGSADPSTGSAQLRAWTEHTIQATRLLAFTLAANGRLGEAAIYARAALTDTMALSGSNTAEAAQGLAVIGMIRLRQGRIEQANALFERAVQALLGAEVQPSSRKLADFRARVGMTLAMQSRWSEAVNVFERRHADLRLNREQFAIRGSGDLEWALSLIRTGQPDRALQMLLRMLKAREASRFGSPLPPAYLHGYLAIALLEQGEDVKAAEQFAMSVPELLKPASDEEGVDGEGAYVHQFRMRVVFESYLELLSKPHSTGQDIAGRDPVEEAFIVADVARNSSVQRAVASSVARANLPAGRLAELARGEQDAENHAQSLSRMLEGLGVAPPDQVSDAAAGALQRELAEANARRDQLRNELARSFPAYRNLTMPLPVSASDVRRVLRGGEAVVSIYAAERMAFVWVITPGTIGFHAVAISRDELARQVAAVRKTVDLTSGKLIRFDMAGAQRLYDVLLRQDAPQWSSAQVLDVLPSAPLAQLPFGLLLTDPVGATPPSTRPPYLAMPWLIKKVAIAQFPSANALVTLRAARESTAQRLPFVGFGAPLFTAADVQSTDMTRGIEAANMEPVDAGSGDETPHAYSVRKLASPATSLDAAQSAALDATGGSEAVAAARGQAALASSAAALQASIFARLPPLPDTGVELTEIARITGAQSERDLFLGERATVENVRRADLARYRIVAFATHGIAPGDVAGLDQPALALSNPALVREGGSGLLTLDDVLTLKLDADWVVLSACNTASGSGIGAEAISGLGRAFFYAGTRSLLVSNWAVETVSARLLTTSVFRHQAASPEMTRAEALREAALEVMNTTGAHYSHPAFWAAFTLAGDGSN